MTEETKEVKIPKDCAQTDCWMYGPKGEAVLLKQGDKLPKGFKDAPFAEKSDDADD